MSVYGNTEGGGGLPQQQRHKPCDFLCTSGWSHEWLHCPICLAHDDGWWPDGRPRYNGGTVTARRPDGTEGLVACLCEYGDQRRQAAGLPRMDHLPEGWTVVQEIRAVLWRRGDSTPPPEEVECPHADEYTRRLGEGMMQLIAGKLTQEEYEAAAARLEEKLMPPKHPVPTVAEVLNDLELRRRYVMPKPTVEQERGPQDWRDGRAAANPDH